MVLAALRHNAGRGPHPHVRPVLVLAHAQLDGTIGLDAQRDGGGEVGSVVRLGEDDPIVLQNRRKSAVDRERHLALDDGVGRASPGSGEDGMVGSLDVRRCAEPDAVALAGRNAIRSGRAHDRDRPAVPGACKVGWRTAVLLQLQVQLRGTRRDRRVIVLRRADVGECGAWKYCAQSTQHQLICRTRRNSAVAIQGSLRGVRVGPPSHCTPS